MSDSGAPHAGTRGEEEAAGRGRPLGGQTAEPNLGEATVKVLGGLELDSVAAGFVALDAMAKKAPLRILEVRTVCPGKYLILVTGSEASVEAAIDAGARAHPECLIESLYLPNAHPDLWSSLRRDAPGSATDAIGILEAFSLLAAIDAADSAAKAARVNLLHIRWGDEMGGKASAKLVGPIAEIEAAVAAGKERLSERGRLCRVTIIPRPDVTVAGYILRG